jgi:serine/threonine protein kinase
MSTTSFKHSKYFRIVLIFVFALIGTIPVSAAHAKVSLGDKELVEIKMKQSASLAKQVWRAVKHELSLKEFEFGERIAAGFNGKVYAAKRLSDNRDVVIKVPHHNSPYLKDEFVNEVILLKTLQEGAGARNVIQLLAYFINSETGLWNIVLEKANGGDLEGLLERQKKANLIGRSYNSLSLQLMREIILGITQIHEKNICHRYLSSSTNL